MQHLKVAASLVSLAIVISFNVSCTTVSPPPSSPTISAGVPSAGLRQPMLAPHLPASVANGSAPLIGTVGAQQPLSFAIHLPLRNQAELTRLLRDLYDPTSPSFHKYLSVSEFTDRFSPTAADYEAVLAWAKANGFSVTATTPNRRLVAVEASADEVNRALNITVNVYRHPSEGRTFLFTGPRAQRGWPRRAAAADHRPQQLRPAASDAAAQGGGECNGLGPSGEYLPSDLRAAYYGYGPLTGAASRSASSRLTDISRAT